ncbi:phosphodiester glycosidase family protein [Aeromicrobium camelliae]|uniref:phosphodiester glycosidase family protein n=1 Tax=Aeromicrobium camelliae TaxID=1538144 RepID=UPI0036341C0A
MAAVLLALLVALVAPGIPGHAAPSDEQLGADGSVLRSAVTERVAPGLDLTNFSRLEERGWNDGNVLTADLTTPTLSMDVVDSGAVTRTSTVSELARDNGAVAAVNGTFFDINHTSAPNYTSISSRDGMRVGTPTAMPSLTLAQGRAAVQLLSAEGTLTVDGVEHELEGLNNPRLPADAIGVYTGAWGDHSLDRPAGAPEAPAEQVALATVVDGTVTEVSGILDAPGAADIAEGEQVLLGRDAGAAVVADLEVGQNLEIEVGPSADVDMAIAGSHQILRDGEVPELSGSLATSVHPRTAVGMNADGTELFVVTIDGRTAASRGMTLPELGEFMADLGAENAVNLDGGGSTSMVARPAGAEDVRVQNTPSDGHERQVPNALVFYSSAPAEQLSDAKIEPQIEGQTTIFAGQHRTFEGIGLGANLERIAADGEFSVDGPVELTEADGRAATVQGTAPGEGHVAYRVGGHQARLPVRIVGELVGLRSSTPAINLADAAASAEVTIDGFDADGHVARMEARDLEVSADPGLRATSDGQGTFLVQATSPSASGHVTFRSGEAQVRVAVAVGTREVPITDFGDLDGFSDETARATGSFSAAKGPEPGTPAVRLQYDFTTSTATRGYYLIKDEPVTIDGDALALEMDIKGDASGAWPRLQVRAADGTVTNVDGPTITWEGWQRTRFTVPAGLAQPLSVERVRIMETRPAASYQGDIMIANLRAITTPAASAESPATVHDPALLAHGTVDERPQRIAVMSDAQFVARDPESGAVDGARRTLREIRAAEPDLLVINGDFVDEASPKDFALARRILDEEWTDDIPFVYVPGNHEIMGGSIENFEAAFGPASTEQTLGRTKLLTMNSAGGSLRSGGMDQLRELERTLDEVADSDHLTGLVVFFHHPPQDPLPTKHSQLSDRREATEIERLLGEFRASSGKSAAVVNGHSGVFHGSATEGVTYLVNGNSGKSPSGTPGNGGFTGWMMLGIDPGAGLLPGAPQVQDRIEWLAAETRPWVDELALEAPGHLMVGQSADVAATLMQDGREVPVAWPVTSQWAGDGVAVDDGRGLAAAAATDAVVRVNPSTGQLTALQPGTATVSVTVNGRSAQLAVEVVADPAQPEVPEQPGEPGEPGSGQPEQPGRPGTEEPDAAPPAQGDAVDRSAARDGALPAAGAAAWTAAAVVVALVLLAAGAAAWRRGSTRES